MSDVEPESASRSLWRIPGWYRRVGLASWFFLGIAAVTLLAVIIAATSEIVAPLVLGAYIPYLGAFIGGAFAVLMALGEGGIGLALIVLAIALAVNLLLENLLEPVRHGSSLSLHPLLILLATSLGGIIAGMIGLILAAPVLAIAIDIEHELKASGFFDEGPVDLSPEPDRVPSSDG